MQQIPQEFLDAVGEPTTGTMRRFAKDPATAVHRPSGGKSFYPLARSDILTAGIQTLTEGGENRLHAHKYVDGFWFVLKGRVRFYDNNDDWIEVGPSEGVLIPRMVEYWFKKVSDEDVELLQVEASDHPTKDIGKFFEETKPRDYL